MNIFYLADSYPEKRCIINRQKESNYYFIDRRKNLYYLSYLFYKKVFKRPFNWDKEASFKISNKLNGIVHTFNTICKTDNYWCSTFESTIPRSNYTCDRIWENDLE